jgi:hypothetical protein
MPTMPEILAYVLAVAPVVAIVVQLRLIAGL